MKTQTALRDAALIDALTQATGLSPTQIAVRIGTAASTITRVRAGYSRLSLQTVEKLQQHFPDFFGDVSDAAASARRGDYVEVEVLPSFAGMGGGGFGEGEPEHSLLPRQLIEERLRGSAPDFLMIECRGDSMDAAGYLHGDQVLVDRRDVRPTQPGAFALFDGDAYVLKLVERVPLKRGKLRIFSANDRYTAYEVDETEVQIVGRPVWLGRSL